MRFELSLACVVEDSCWNRRAQLKNRLPGGGSLQVCTEDNPCLSTSGTVGVVYEDIQSTS